MSTRSKKIPPVRKGIFEIPIYSIKDKGYLYFRIVYRLKGQRKQERFRTEKQARLRGLEIIASFNSGDLDTLPLTPAERTEYTQAKNLLRPLGISLDVAILDFSEAKEILGNVPVLAAAKFYQQRHPANLLRKSVREICEEFVQSKKDRTSRAYLLRLRQMLVGRVMQAKVLRSDRHEITIKGASKIQARRLLNRSQELIDKAVSKLRAVGRSPSIKFYDLKTIETAFLLRRKKGLANLNPERYEICRNGATVRTIAGVLGTWAQSISELIEKNAIEPLFLKPGHDLYDLSQIEAALPPRILEKPSHSFCSTFNCDLSSISGHDLVRWIDSLTGGPQSKNDHRGIVFELWKFAKKRGYLPRDNFEVELIEKRRVPVAEIEIYEPEEVFKLLSPTSGPLRAVLALTAFGALRQEDACDLDWSQVGVAGGKFIEVKRGQGKTGVQRLIPIQENLRAWLEPCRKASGPIWPHARVSFKSHYHRWCRKMGFAIKRNALRHSYVSYRIAQTGSMQSVAMEAGNSVRVIQKHYLRPVTPEAAAKYFSVVPADANDKIAYLQASG
jgi:hypothetical protein